MTPATPTYAILYKSGPGYGTRHRVLAITDGQTRRVTLQNIVTGDIVVVPVCDVDFL